LLGIPVKWRDGAVSKREDRFRKVVVSPTCASLQMIFILKIFLGVKIAFYLRLCVTIL
jgi:hypothetical protein